MGEGQSKICGRSSKSEVPEWDPLLLIFLSYAGLTLEQAGRMVLDHVCFGRETRREIYVPEPSMSSCGRLVVLEDEAFRCLDELLTLRWGRSLPAHPTIPFLMDAPRNS